ncbi:hypothetical protein ACTQ6A_15590 [Lachnospiraceae bacterium LCP25S3_G4]
MVNKINVKPILKLRKANLFRNLIDVIHFSEKLGITYDDVANFEKVQSLLHVVHNKLAIEIMYQELKRLG